MPERVYNILITSSAAKAPLLLAMKEAASRALPGASVIAGDINPLCPTRYLADDFWLMPSLDSVHPTHLLHECLMRNIKVIFPTRDSELKYWAKARSLFRAEGIHVVISDTPGVSLCLDKLKFGRLITSNKLKVIPSTSSLEEVNSDSVVVKERFGAGSKLVKLNLDINQAAQHAKSLKEPIFQPFIQGTELSVDAWSDQHGNVVGVVIRKRELVVNGESQVTSTLRSEGLEATIIQFLSSLALFGPIVLQLILAENGEVHVVECNCRFGGATTLSIHAGLDLLYWTLMTVIDNDFKPMFRRINNEVRQIRFPMDVIHHDIDL